MPEESVDVALAKLQVVCSNMEQRLQKIETTAEQIHRLTTSVEKLAINMAHTNDNIATSNKEIEKISKRLATIESEPKHKMSKLWDWIIGGAVAAIVAFIMHLILNP